MHPVCHVDVRYRDIVCHSTWRKKLDRWKWRVIGTRPRNRPRGTPRGHRGGDRGCLSYTLFQIKDEETPRMASVNLQSIPRAASVLAENLHLDVNVVRTVITLLDKDNTVPFIARYRKEQTGGLDPTMLRHIQAQYEQLKWVEILVWHSFFSFREWWP